jgi:hypothetical protein
MAKGRRPAAGTPDAFGNCIGFASASLPSVLAAQLALAAAVVDHDLLAERLAHLVGDHAPQRIVTAARRERDDEGDRPGRVGLGAGVPRRNVAIDLETHTATGPDGAIDGFEIDPFRKECLLAGTDDISFTLGGAGSTRLRVELWCHVRELAVKGPRRHTRRFQNAGFRGSPGHRPAMKKPRQKAGAVNMPGGNMRYASTTDRCLSTARRLALV